MKETISKKQLREFGLLIGLGFPILIGWLIPALTGHGLREWTLWVGFLGLIIGLTSPRLLNYPYKFWMKLGFLLGWANSRIILGLVYMIVLLPIAFIMRLTGYDPLRTKLKKEKTYRENRKNHIIDLTRIFWTMAAFLDLVKDIWDFLKVRKKYWLAPLIITIVLMGALIVFSQGSVVAPFIYSIFW